MPVAKKTGACYDRSPWAKVARQAASNREIYVTTVRPATFAAGSDRL
jgi:hypothetical protein